MLYLPLPADAQPMKPQKDSCQNRTKGNYCNEDHLAFVHAFFFLGGTGLGTGRGVFNPLDKF